MAEIAYDRPHIDVEMPVDFPEEGLVRLPNPPGERDGDIRLRAFCRGCGRVRNFVAPSWRLIARAIACAGWKIDEKRAECPSCWLAYEASVIRAAKGNT